MCEQTLLKPAIGIATAWVFQALPPDDYSDGGASRRLVEAWQAGRLHARKTCITARSVGRWNTFQRLRGRRLIRLSGSGPTLYASFASLASAKRALEQLQSSGYEVYLTRAVSSEGESATFR
jgi:4-diphosphocytidyl-2C-methyl-D-erythritol kinase